jgi:hypothetical protein
MLLRCYSPAIGLFLSLLGASWLVNEVLVVVSPASPILRWLGSPGSKSGWLDSERFGDRSPAKVRNFGKAVKNENLASRS